MNEQWLSIKELTSIPSYMPMHLSLELRVKYDIYQTLGVVETFLLAGMYDLNVGDTIILNIICKETEQQKVYYLRIKQVNESSIIAETI